MKKINWSQFWNFIIQFFVVMLGVLVTFWISGINENSRQKKKTRQALVLITEELEDYLVTFEHKKTDLELEIKMYNEIMHYSHHNYIPSTDTLLLYKKEFFTFNFAKSTNLSIDIAEKTGAFATITDLSLLERIYNSFLLINTIYETHERMHSFKKEQVSKSLANKSLNPEILESSAENDNPDAIRKLWDSLISNEDTYLVITTGFFDIQVVNGLLEEGSRYIRETIAKINEYLN